MRPTKSIRTAIDAARTTARSAASRRQRDTMDRGAVAPLDGRLAYNEHGGFMVPASSAHRVAAQTVLNGDVYEAATIDFLVKAATDGDIVHAGAYFGDFLPALAAACWPSGKVWAFEPNQENFRCAQTTIVINGLRNVVLTEAALGERRATQVLRIQDEAGQHLGGGSRLVRPDETSDGVDLPVRVVAIDRTIPRRRRVTVIHLDVEGHEQWALSGARRTIERWRPTLVIEDLPRSDFLESGWFEQFITETGYERTGLIDGNAIFTSTAGEGQE